MNTPSANGTAAAATAKKVTAKKVERDERFKDVTVVRKGTQIVLPEDMDYEQAHIWLTKLEKDETVEIVVDETLPVFPLEGAYAFTEVLNRTYGFFEKLTVPGFFRDSPPQLITIDVGFNQTKQVSWGRVKLHDIDGYLDMSVGDYSGRPAFRVTGKIKQRDKGRFEALMKDTKAFVKENSIYRGKALRISFPDTNAGEAWSYIAHAPQFIDSSHADPKNLILNKSNEAVIRTTLFTPVRHTEACRRDGIPLKRGILLEGKYGVGKTLTAEVLEYECERHGWTFIYLTNVDRLAEAIRFAKQYEPAVIFAEDIDKVLEDERDSDMDDILNTIDGVDTKGMEVMFLLTTNFVEKIERAALRPGRLDAVITVDVPDAEAAERLVRHYSGNRLLASADLTEVGKKLAGQVPATIREIVERSRLAAIDRTGGADDYLLDPSDLLISAEGMINHLRLLNSEREVAPKPGDAFIEAVAHRTAHIVKNGTEQPQSN